MTRTAQHMPHGRAPHVGASRPISVSTASAWGRMVTDLTMITTGEGPLWLSAIRDAFSRRVLAWE
ncbi:hypothetical protein, partial [Streptomyces sp. NPDC050564]|uniref:hypothetical protein n=1 Tax=Streptomyces sp. NPDC050564 TaxID=3365631 RepID=UPI0037B90A66